MRNPDRKDLALSQGASVGDIDGDGALELVVGTAAGRMHALRGSTGAEVGHIPLPSHPLCLEIYFLNRRWPYLARLGLKACPPASSLHHPLTANGSMYMSVQH